MSGISFLYVAVRYAAPPHIAVNVADVAQWLLMTRLANWTAATFARQHYTLGRILSQSFRNGNCPGGGISSLEILWGSRFTIYVNIFETDKLIGESYPAQDFARISPIGLNANGNSKRRLLGKKKSSIFVDFSHCRPLCVCSILYADRSAVRLVRRFFEVVVGPSGVTHIKTCR